MLRQITGTIASRMLVTLMNLLVMMIAGHALGAEGLGTISLIVLGITLVMLPASLLGADELTYLAPRAPLRAFAPRGYVWGIACALLAWPVLRFLPLVPAGYEAHVCALAGMQALYSINLGVLLGKQRVLRHNMITAAQAALLLTGFVIALRFTGDDPFAYVLASYAAFGSTLIASTIALWPVERPTLPPAPDVPRFMLRQGIITQGANAMQLFNYRLAYWIIEHFRGRAALGLYSVGNQLAESAWIAPRSLGLVLYSHVSGTDDAARQRTLALAVAKASIVFALFVVVLLCVTPDAVFRTAFGKDISGLRPIALLLAPGIVCMAASQAFSAYFSGTARNVHNMIGSGLGLLVTTSMGLLLVPRYALEGAAAAASCAYAANVLYQTTVFMHITRSSLRDLLPSSEDLSRLRTMAARAFRT